jgi:hypothetical protein
VVRTGLEGHVHRRAERPLAGHAQGHDLGVIPAIPRVIPFADDLSIAHKNGADHWVRRRLSPPQLSERERPRH